MKEKITIQKLMITDKFMRQKRLLQDRGELALIEDGKSFRHLGYFSLKKGSGYTRGNHYHLKKTEHFYIISGKLRIQLVDLDTGKKSNVWLQAGHRVEIHPRCAHRFIADEDAQVIEYYDTTYDPEDDLDYVDF
ncbi:MAG: WxcM-like domain-containing protein [Deltaproteobacteria bacterium]|nr:WxcM-like domain-containing protein [Deltaproteobacteria bacterium]MBW2150463.1 WxcM-like domain-containing protein [Deltaproteobacteria bacterium]